MMVQIPPELHGQKILITGGAGAIGSRMVKALTPVADILVVDDFSSGYRIAIDPSVRLIQGSINESRVLHEAFEFNPRYVVHLAANFANQNSVDNPEKDLMVNGMGTLRVLQEAARAGVEGFVYSSSSCIYGGHSGELRESMATMHLDTPYAVSKLLGEYYSNYFAEATSMRSCSVRYFNSFGPSEFPGPYRNVIPNFIFKALKGQSLEVMGDGSSTRDFTYIDDSVTGTLLALTRGVAGEVYNVGTGVETEVIYLAKRVNELTGNTSEIKYRPQRSWDRIAHRKASLEKSKELLGYNPQVSFDEGLVATVDWLRENFDMLVGAVGSR